jgi:chaperonin GroES
MSLTLLGNRILVKPDHPEAFTKGGLIIPDSAKKPAGFGVVRAIGPGMLMKNGERWPMPEGITVGARVVFDARDPFPKVILDGEELLSMRDDHILAELCE